MTEVTIVDGEASSDEPLPAVVGEGVLKVRTCSWLRWTCKLLFSHFQKNMRVCCLTGPRSVWRCYTPSEAARSLGIKLEDGNDNTPLRNNWKVFWEIQKAGELWPQMDPDGMFREFVYISD
jgi:hypothetical protein